MNKDSAVRSLYDSLFQSLELADIVYCLWKGAHKLPSLLDSAEDLDLLVARSDLRRLESVLVEHQFLEVLLEPHRRDVGTTFWVRPVGGRRLSVHVHTSVIFGRFDAREFHLPIESAVLENRVFYPVWNIWAASPKDDSMLFFLRHLMRTTPSGRPVDFAEELSSLKTFYRLPSTQIGEDDDSPYPKLLRRLLVTGSELSESELRSARREAQDFLRSFRHRPSTPRRARAVLSALALRLGRGGRISRGLSRSELASGGCIIALVGIDGSGKSSALERLSGRSGLGIPTTTISMGSGSSGAGAVRRALMLLLGTSARTDAHRSARTASRAETAQKVDFPFYYKIWQFLCLRDKQRELDLGLRFAASGGLVLSDRWPQASNYDALDAPRLQSMNCRTRFDRYLVRKERLLYRTVSQIELDLLVILEISPETSVARKPADLSLEEAAAGVRKLRSLDWNARRVAIVDADQDIASVDRDLVHAIVRVLSGSTDA